MSKKTSIIISTVVAVALIIGGIFFFSNRDKAGDNVVVPETEATASAEPTTAPTSEATAIPTKPATKEEAVKDFEELKEFDEVTEVDNFSKEDVEAILGYSSDYAYNSMTNAYFLSGKWYEDGMPNILDDVAGHFFEADIREQIKSWDTNPDTGKDIAKKVAPLVFYLSPNGEISPHPACAEERSDFNETTKEVQISCPLSGLEFSKMSYEPTMSEETPGVKVEFSATGKIPVKMGEKDVYTEVRYDYVLNFISNENYEETVNPNRFVINFYEVQINHGAVVAL